MKYWIRTSRFVVITVVYTVFQISAVTRGETLLETRQLSTVYTGYRSQIQRITIVQPKTGGPYPLFVWLTGTNGVYNDAVAMRIIESMAEQGVVAATVEYPGSFLDKFRCEELQEKASTIFDSGSKSSALSRIRKKSGLLDTQSIVVAGHSQGSWLAHLGMKMNGKIKAGWFLGTGVLLAQTVVAPTPCNVASPSDQGRVRAINGGGDEAYGLSLLTKDPDKILRNNLSNVKAVSVGRSTSNALSFENPNTGGGWYVIQPTETNGTVSHFYHVDPNTQGPDFTWDTTDAPWGREYNQHWLMEVLGEE